MDDVILSLRNITKTYPGVVALDDFSLDIRRGEIHALLGENGAGKSTLIKTVSGAIVPDAGLISFGNDTCRRMTPIKAKQHGVEVVYQEFNLVETMSVAENIYLGDRHGRVFDEKRLFRKAGGLFEELKIDLDPKIEVAGLSPAKKQLVEICKCVVRDAKLIIMDEPTAPLSSVEVENVFRIIQALKSKGVTIIFISHRLEELFRISDRVTVMRDGRFVRTLITSGTNRRELVKLMVGRELKETYPARATGPGDIALEVRDLSGYGVRDISFHVRKGEILGIAGLVGAGRTELAGVVFGAAPKEKGEIRIGGRVVEIRSPRDAIRMGMGLIPEDRKDKGCLQAMTIRFNISIAAIKALSVFFHIGKKKETELVEKYRTALDIRTPSLAQEVRNLSGGNQQKVVLAKSLAASPQILIFDEPTRGIDVGAKQEIYGLINGLVREGKAVIMISSDMEELLGMSDRVFVMHEGTAAGELTKAELNPESVIALASGIRKEELTDV